MGSELQVDMPWRITQSSRTIVFAGPCLVLWGALFGFFGWKALLAPMPGESGSTAVIAVFSGTGALLLGLGMLTSRAKVRANAESTLDVDEWGGPFRLRRSFAVESLTHIAAVRTPKMLGSGWIDEHAALKLYTTDGKTAVVMKHYRRQQVCETVEKIASALGFVPVDLAGATDKTEIEFAHPSFELEEPAAAANADVAAAANVRIAATRKASGAGLRLEMPASGITPLLSNMFGFGALFTVVSVPIILLVWNKAEEIRWFVALPGILLFAGVWLLLYGLALSRRRAMVEVDAKELVVTLNGGFYGKRQHRWPREHVLNVEVVDGYVHVQNQAMMRLHIHARFGSRKLMQGRPKHELQWAAEQLRTELGIAHPADQ